MDEEVRSMLLAPAGLYLPLVAALVLTLLRTPSSRRVGDRTDLIRIFLIGVAVQCAHFGEEYLTSIHTLFPPLFGLASVPARFFVGFNVFFIMLWLVCSYGVKQGLRAAYFPVWFFGLAMCLNGIIHPLLAVWVGGYFPGLLTSPVAGVMGVLVTKKLIQSTELAVG